MEIKEIVEKIKDVVKKHPKRKQYEDGKFYGNPVPIAPPVGYNPQPTLREQIRAMVVSEKLRAEAEAAGFESFEEADDFDVDDEWDPRSPYEYNFDPPLTNVPAGAEPSPKRGEATGGAEVPAGESVDETPLPSLKKGRKPAPVAPEEP